MNNTEPFVAQTPFQKDPFGFIKQICPVSVRQEWKKRFTTDGYTPDFMPAYLGERRPLEATLEDLEKDVNSSKLSGCSLTFLAEYRDSFEYVLSTLKVVQNIKNGKYSGLSETLIDRLNESIRSRERALTPSKHGTLPPLTQKRFHAPRLQRAGV